MKAIDYLSNSEIISDSIALEGKDFTESTLLINSQKTMRLEVRCLMWGNRGDGKNADDNSEGCFLEAKPLHPSVLEDLKAFWEQESVKRGYYNTSKNIQMI